MSIEWKNNDHRTAMTLLARTLRNASEDEAAKLLEQLRAGSFEEGYSQAMATRFPVLGQSEPQKVVAKGSALLTQCPTCGWLFSIKDPKR